MKKARFALLCLIFISRLHAQPVYTASIVVDDIYWQSPNEFNGVFHAELFLNDSLVDNSNLTHKWYHKENGQGDFNYYDILGDIPSIHIDDVVPRFYQVYVIIQVPNCGNVESEVVTISKAGTPEETHVFALKEDDSQVDIGTLPILLWTGFQWTSPRGLGNVHFMSSEEYLNVCYNGSLGQKFYRSEDHNLVMHYQNYDPYLIYHAQGGGHYPNSIRFRLKSQNDASIRAQLIDATNINSSVQFKDPWLEDQSGFGGLFRSSGMQAAFNDVQYSSQNPYNLGINSTYKGVFLTQRPEVEGIYYSIRAPLTQQVGNFTGIFQNWTTSSATLQQVGSNPSGYDQKAVVFNSGGATVTANYKAHLGSNVSTVLQNQGARKLVFDGSDDYTLTYESAGEIWSTTDWGNETRLSLGNGSNSLPAATTKGGPIFTTWQRNTGGNNYTVYYHSNTSGNSQI